MTQAQRLVDGVTGSSVIGDRAYDSDAFVAHVRHLGMQVVVPSRSKRRRPRAIDASLYGKRNVIERLFGRLKQFRRVATRYDKTVASYGGFFVLAASLVALSGWRP